MFMTSITSVYYGDTSIVGNYLGGSLPGVPDDNYIGVTANYPRHISHTFTFSQRSCPDINCTYDSASKPVHCRLK